MSKEFGTSRICAFIKLEEYVPPIKPVKNIPFVGIDNEIFINFSVAEINKIL